MQFQLNKQYMEGVTVTVGGKIVFQFVSCYIRLAMYCDIFGMPVCKQVSVCPH